MKVIKAFISQVLRCLINFLPSLGCSQAEIAITGDGLEVLLWQGDEPQPWGS